ncbi:TIGR03619 family F420-dependent LLM class oxidoreductase [Peterkaempfera griseoplana]|uniref:TIGR03619 family F420-dependent LLM class oxidoreductase n=1 Tax=Peterkaempfera griseoplana TaxID=66896 RepID=UPI0006E40398|nr:TIGR03619 family F420-dependent LLM class oxidoreductase [Peterkaempfera griseoplana]
MTMRLGLGLPQMKQYTLAKDVAGVARRAEEIGYDSLWVFERVLVPENPTQGLYGIPGLPWPDNYRSVADPLVVLALAAAATERCRLGSSVLVAPLHGPFQLARNLATLDVASNGRVVAGFGTGWSLDEYAAAAVAPFEERGAALDALLDICAAVWGPDPVSYQVRNSVVREAAVGPKPAAPIPVYLAAGSVRALERVARRADGWLPTGAPPSVLGARWRQLTERAAALGRDPGALGFCVRANVELTRAALPDADRSPFTGSVEQIVADVAAHAEVGAGEVLLDIQGSARDGAELADLAAELHSAVRGAGV